MPYLRSIDDDLELFQISGAFEDTYVLRSESTVMRQQPLSNRNKRIECGTNALPIEPIGRRNDENSGVQNGLPTSSVQTSPVNPSFKRLANISQCPVRLMPQVPPVNYGAVEKDMIFRSGFPNENNIDFMMSLRIRSILTLVSTPASDVFCQYVRQFDVNHIRLDINPNKNGIVSTTMDSLCEALLFAMNPTNHPLYIHCNQGRHRTGCIIGCLRKIQQWPVDEILSEYEAYSTPKSRPGDRLLIETFDPAIVYQFAKSRGYLQEMSQALGTPVSQLTDVFALAAGLPRHKLSQLNDQLGDDEMSHPLLPLRDSQANYQLSTLSDRRDETRESSSCALKDENDGNEVALGIDPDHGIFRSCEAAFQNISVNSTNLTRPRAMTPTPAGA